MIADDDIRRVVSHRAFDAGLEYQSEGRVQDLRTMSDGATIHARVNGSGRASYKVTILVVRDRRGRIVPSGTCSCPVGFNCKHVAAVLFEYQEQTALTLNDSYLPSQPPGLPRERRPVGMNDVPMNPVAQTDADLRLPHDVEAWLHTLDVAQQVESEDYPPTVRKRLLYVLDRGPHSGGLIVRPQSIELKRDGTTSRTSTRHLPDELLRNGQQPKFLRPSDRTILRQLIGVGAEGTDAFIATLRGIIATGRGRWANWDGPSLTEGPSLKGELDWRLLEDGSQRPELLLPPSLVALRLASPWYVEPATGVIGPVETELPARVIQAMLTGPALPSAIAGRVREEMERRWPGQRFPAPKQLTPPEILRKTLQPHLLTAACSD